MQPAADSHLAAACHPLTSGEQDAARRVLRVAIDMQRAACTCLHVSSQQSAVSSQQV
jgi:hypothetical protein